MGFEFWVLSWGANHVLKRRCLNLETWIQKTNSMSRKMLIFLFLGISGVLIAQQDAAIVERRPISEQAWDRAAKDLDYSKDLPKAQKENSRKKSPSSGSASNPFNGFNSEVWGTVFQLLAILIALAVIGYGVYRMLNEPRSKRIVRDGALITMDNLEEHLHETDLDRFLKIALANGDYAQAVRIYFLQMIKQLSASGAIHWSKEKTNRDYLREMRTHRQFDAFRELTLTYERVWYGNVSLDAGGFANIEPRFKSFSSLSSL